MRYFLKYVFLAFVLSFTATLYAQERVPSPLTLEEATKLFLERNLSLMSARYKIDIAEAEIITARLLPNPVFGFSAGYITANNPVLKKDANPREFDYMFSQLIETAGKRGYRKAVADWGKEIAKVGFEDALRKQLYDFRKLFYQIVSTQMALELMGELLASYEELTRPDEAESGNEDSPAAELVELEKNSLKIEMEQTLLDLRIAKNTLLGMLNYTDFGQTVDIEEKLSFRDEVLSLDRTKQVAMASRPDLRAVHMRVEQVEEMVELAESLKYPDITVGTVYQLTPDYPREHTFGVNIGVPLPVFSRNQGNIMKAKTELQKAKTDEEILITNIVTEVENTFRSYETKRRLVGAFEVIMKQSEKTLDVIRRKYRPEASSLPELIEAYRAVYKTRGAYSKALLDYQLSLEQLRFVTNSELQEIEE